MWVSNFILQSISTPRSLVWVTGEIVVLLLDVIVNMDVGVVRSVGWNIISLVLLGFSISWVLVSHSSTEKKEACIFTCSSWSEGEEQISADSFAYRMTETCRVEVWRLLVMTEKCKGPKMEPWGMPSVTISKGESSTSTALLAVYLLKTGNGGFAEIQFWEGFNEFVVVNHIKCLREVKKDRGDKVAIVSVVVHLWVNDIRAVVVLW